MGVIDKWPASAQQHDIAESQSSSKQTTASRILCTGAR